MKIVWILLIVAGVYFLASAATEQGQLPSGHGTGRASEVVLGVIVIAYGIYRLKRK